MRKDKIKAKAKITEPLPECWVDKQSTKSKKKLYGIWAKYNTATKSKIETECGTRGTGPKKRKESSTKKRKGNGSG